MISYIYTYLYTLIHIYYIFIHFYMDAAVSILSYDDKDLNLSNNLSLSIPSSVQGGSYFTKIHYAKRPLYMQSPKCVSKQGIIAIGKKTYIELVISNEKDGEFISFLENLEKACIDIIFEKRHIWFTDELEKTDIETAFASIIKSYKHGTSHLLKLNINNTSNHAKHGIGIGGLQTCFMFDENNNPLKFDHVKPETQLITIIEFEGIKFTQKSFQFEMNARQMLIIDEKPIFNSCLIKTKKKDDEQNEKDEKMDNNRENKGDDKGHDKGDNGDDKGDDELKTTEATAVTVTLASKAEGGMHTTDNTDSGAHNEMKMKETETESTETIKSEECVGKLNLKQLKQEEEEKDLEVNRSSENKTVNKHSIEIHPEYEGELELVEINLDIPQEMDPGFEKIRLQNANEVYYKMYKEAKEKAKSAKKIAVEAYLTAEEIKFTYNLVDNESDSDSDSSDSSDDGDNGDNGDNGENGNGDNLQQEKNILAI
jgi:hypothetical protein